MPLQDNGSTKFNVDRTWKLMHVVVIELPSKSDSVEVTSYHSRETPFLLQSSVSFQSSSCNILEVDSP